MKRFLYVTICYRFVGLLLAILFCSLFLVAMEIAQTIGNPTRDTIHRFFDSSPLSSDSRYLVVSELPNSGQLLQENKATVLVTDLNSSNQVVYRDYTYAWAGQLGTQAQFFGSLLFYNKLSFNHSHCHSYADFNKLTCKQSIHLHSIVVNMINMKVRKLPCPVYHAAGDLTVSVNNLFRFQLTQRGYGIDWLSPDMTTTNIESTKDDAIVVNHIHNRSCTQLITIKAIAKSINLDSKDIHGFHTKLSHDGKYIIFVLRSFHQAPSSSSLFISTVFAQKAKSVRVQHLFIISTTPTDPVQVRYVLSWASKPFFYQDQVIHLPDGNHPTWVPNSYDITMNLDIKSLSPPGSLDKRCYNGRGWATVRILTKTLLSASSSSMRLFHRNYEIHLPQHEVKEAKEAYVSLIVVSSVGTGHPSYRPGNRQEIVTDAYPKELPYLQGHVLKLNKDRQSDDIYVPIMLTTVFNNSVRVIASHHASQQRGRELSIRSHDMRCDPHPAWSPGGDKLAVNLLNITTGKRMVGVISMV